MSGALAAEPDDLSSLSCGRRIEQIPAACPLTSRGLPRHMYTHAHGGVNIKNYRGATRVHCEGRVAVAIGCWLSSHLLTFRNSFLPLVCTKQGMLSVGKVSQETLELPCIFLQENTGSLHLGLSFCSRGSQWNEERFSYVWCVQHRKDEGIQRSHKQWTTGSWRELEVERGHYLQVFSHHRH